MATSKQLNDFAKKALSQQESLEVKGGKSYIPTDTGSSGYINWDDVDIRNENVSTSPSQGLKLFPTRIGK
jgi:hypothetical protein